MKKTDLWKRYCSFYEKDFSEQVEFSKARMKEYFKKWRKTALAKILCKEKPLSFRDVPVTTYSDYPMLSKFGRMVIDETKRNPKRHGELYKYYYDKICAEISGFLNEYMVEPFYLCMKTTGTTGESKWVAHGETFWKNFYEASIATALVACSDGWGETKLREGDKCLNMNASIPYVSGWGAWASKDHFNLIPSIDVADNLKDMRERFYVMLKAIRKGEKITIGGGIGSMFYMLCKHFTDPEEFYREYYYSLGPGLRKVLLYLKIVQTRLGRKEKRNITEIIPLKGVIIAGVEAGLYIDFFRREFNLEPLNVYGSTEAGPLMRGDPDRKTDLIPDMRTSYIEFLSREGEIKDIDELKKGEIYNVVVTPIGSILFRYDMEDYLRVIDFRDDGMPVFAFEGRKMTIIRLYSWYRVTPNLVVTALSKAGLKSSDKWAVIKLLKPQEHLHFLMEKTWPYSEREAEKIIFKALIETDLNTPHTGRTLRDYIRDFRIKDPSEVVRVEYLRPGTFLRYSMLKAKAGAPIGQYKPPKIIPTEKIEIYHLLKQASKMKM